MDLGNTRGLTEGPWGWAGLEMSERKEATRIRQVPKRLDSSSALTLSSLSVQSLCLVPS